MTFNNEPQPPFGFETDYRNQQGPMPLSYWYRFRSSKSTRTKVHRYVRYSDAKPDYTRRVLLIIYHAVHFKDRWWIAMPQARPRKLMSGTRAEVMAILAAHLLTSKQM